MIQIYFDFEVMIKKTITRGQLFIGPDIMWVTMGKNYLKYCGGTGINTTIPTNTIQVTNTTGTVTDTSSVYTGLSGVISGYIYGTGEL